MADSSGSHALRHAPATRAGDWGSAAVCRAGINVLVWRRLPLPARLAA